MNPFLTKSFPATVNGDNVIAFTDAKNYKTSLVEHNLGSLASWYYEDPDKNHLGLLNLFSNIANYPVPMYMGMINNGATISVNGIGASFRYDLPVTKTFAVVTAEDTSGHHLKPGIDGSLFDIVLNTSEFTAYDVITYDAANGCNILISGEIPSKTEGDLTRYWCRVIGGKAKYFPKEKLRPGIRYWKIGHALGEYSTQFSKVSGADKAGSLTCEFRLGNHRGVEGETTMYAGMKSMQAAQNSTSEFVETALRRMNAMRSEYEGNIPDLAIIGKTVNGRLDLRTAKVASTLEVFCMAELVKLEARQLMWQEGGVIMDQNGPIHLNEGIYRQLRRGYTIHYSRPMGITKDTLMAAASYIFRGRQDLPITERKIKFKVGAMAMINLEKLIRESFFTTLSNLSWGMGSDRMLPSNPISGTNDAMILGPVQVKGAFIPGIGNVEFEHDPSLDYADMTDRSELVNGMYPRSSYSCIIENITDAGSTNAYSAIPNTANAKLGNMNNNVFYIKPEGVSMWWGYEYGRWAHKANGNEIVSSLPGMKEQFWCHSASAAWVMDNSKFLIIELQPNYFG